MIETPVVTTISLLGECTLDHCVGMAADREQQLAVPKYSEGVSLMAVPDTLEEWRSEHRTARKRSDRCERLGYRFSEIDRSEYLDDIYEINTSLGARQGRQMSDGYKQRVTFGKLPEYPCAMHNIRTYGVLEAGALRAYLTLYRVGELALVSMILGHGSHLRCEIMYLLFAGVVDDQSGLGGWFYYNRHDSGTEGLVFFKERLGFRAEDVAWT